MSFKVGDRVEALVSNTLGLSSANKWLLGTIEQLSLSPASGTVFYGIRLINPPVNYSYFQWVLEYNIRLPGISYIQMDFTISPSGKKCISRWPHICPRCGGPGYLGIAPGDWDCPKECEKKK